MATVAISETEICNRALIKIGAKTILNMDDDNKRARNCRVIYPRERNTLMRSHPWKFAIKRQSLALSTEVVPGWDYVYALPSDILRVIYPDVNIHLYRIEQDKLLTNVPLTYIRYIFEEENPAKFDESFATTLACKMAMELAKSIADNDALREDMAQDYARAISDARSVNAMEDGPSWIDSEEWLSSRYMGIAGPTGWLRDNRRY